MDQQWVQLVQGPPDLPVTAREGTDSLIGGVE